jgi:hypothetical protein
MKITTQHAAPAKNGTQVVSAPPQRVMTIHNAFAAPAQTGSSRMAIMNLIHFGTRECYPQTSQIAQILRTGVPVSSLPESAQSADKLETEN